MNVLEAARARLALGAVAIGCLAIAVAATHAADIAQRSPIEPEGAWREAFVLGVAGAATAWIVGILAHRRAGLDPRAAVAVAVTAQLVPLAAPLLLSLDVYAYWDYGRLIVAHGLNPYADAPSAATDDPAFELMGRDWREQPAIYGPVFVGIAAAHAAIAGADPDTAAFLWRLLAAATGVALTLLAARLARRPALAAVFVGWNPLVALHLAGGGHNDGLMMTLVLGALLLARRGRSQLGGLLWALAIAVKPVPLVLLPLAALAAGRLRGFGWIGFAAGVLGIAITATAAFGTAWISSAAPVGQLDRVSSVSIPYWVAKLDVSWRYPSAALTLLFGLAYLVLLVQAWHGRARLGLAAGLLALSLAWLMPWYALWSVSLAAWEEDRVAKAVALVLTLYLLRDTISL